MSFLSEIKQLRGEVGDLVTRHDAARDVADFGKYANDPAGFMRDVLRAEPWSMQLEMAERVRDNPRTIVVTANGLGKDWVVARIALWWAFARKGMVILTGPTERQVKQILMRELRSAFSRCPELPGELYSLELRINDSAGILAFTSDNADRLTGFHHPKLLICVTEGQGVEEEAYEAALACATGPENRLFVYGNPTQPTGPFYRAAHSDNWSTLTVPATAHPNILTGRAEIPGAVSQEWIQMMRDEYGMASSIYRARVLAEFPEDSVEGLIRRDWLRAAFARHESGELETVAARYRPILALDVARFGPDKTVLAVVQGPIVRELMMWHGASLTETADRVYAHGTKMGCCVVDDWRPTVYCDEPGLGGGIIDILKKKDYPTKAFNGGHSPKDITRFLNCRSETHWALRTLLENNRVAIPRDASLEEEALAVEWQTNAKGLVQIVGKDTIRKTLGRSPDRLDAVVIGLSQSTWPFKRNLSGLGHFEIA